jgi:hypothetical protein
MASDDFPQRKSHLGYSLPFEARYAGWCKECGEPFAVGAQIAPYRWVSRSRKTRTTFHYAHSECAFPAEARAEAEALLSPAEIIGAR